MNRARFVWLSGIALIVAGFLPALAFTLAMLVPSAEASAVLGLFPAIPWVDARKIWWAPHPMVTAALAGVAVMMIGATLVRRQRSVFDALRNRRADARRRAPLYGMERVEPTLGPLE